MAEEKKHTILLVDDEPEILYSLKGLLRREFELYTAESGREALRVLAEHPIHVVMTDQRMPEMTGVELMGRVKSEYPEAIRIVFTGYADIKAVVKAINEGGLYRYVTKPWDPDELIEMLHEAAREHDRIVEQRRLRRDLHEHLERAKMVAERCESGAAPSDLAAFREATGELLQRLEQVEEV